jgi:hypothetical protein
VQRQQAIVNGAGITFIDPEKFLHLARTWRVFR